MGNPPIHIKIKRGSKRKLVAPTKARKVIIACGMGADFIHKITLPALDKLKKTSSGYLFRRGNIHYNISIVTTVKGFHNALNTEEAIVIYYFHSRYGQGPAFQGWEDYFRMSYDYVNIPCKDEIFDHSTNPTQIPNNHSGKMFVSKHVRKVIASSKNRLKNKKWSEWGCNFRKSVQRPLSGCDLSLAYSLTSLQNRDFWYLRLRPIYEEDDYWTIVKGGAGDLDSVDLKCSVLFMYSCSSKKHYLKTLRRRKRQTKSKCVFYLTKRVVNPTEAPKKFLELLFKGKNPYTNKGSKQFLKHMNSIGSAAGKINYYR